MDGKKNSRKKIHTTASLTSLYGSEQELPFEARNNDIEARLQKYSNGYAKVVDLMRNKNAGVATHSPHFEPKVHSDSMVHMPSRNHLLHTCSIGPSGKEEFSMLLSPKSPKPGMMQDRLATKLYFGSTAAISNDGMTTIIDRQSSKATDQDQPSGRGQKLQTISTQLMCGSSLSIQDPEEADILKAGGFGSLKEAFEHQARMVAGSNPVRHADDLPNRPTGAHTQADKVASSEPDSTAGSPGWSETSRSTSRTRWSR